jgi:dihydrofolate reductase
MRELRYYVACTVDGFIARQDGSFDFFPTSGEHMTDLMAAFPETFPGHVRQALGIDASNQCFDAVLMGRRTYDVGAQIGVTSPYPHLAQYLFSRTQRASPDQAVHLVSQDPVAFVQRLKQQSGKDIWLCGGGELATVLFPEINELILKVNPILLGGNGVPLFADEVPLTTLELVDSRRYSSGVQLQRYRLTR